MFYFDQTQIANSGSFKDLVSPSQERRKDALWFLTGKHLYLDRTILAKHESPREARSWTRDACALSIRLEQTRGQATEETLLR
jgi:hypothetical protein